MVNNKKKPKKKPKQQQISNFFFSKRRKQLIIDNLTVFPDIVYIKINLSNMNPDPELNYREIK